MEWVETTAKTVEEAKEQALDQLGVAADDAEFEVVEEPRSGLFGRMRGEARVRARVRPTQVRPKVDRRRRSRADRADPAVEERPDAKDASASGGRRAPAARRAGESSPRRGGRSRVRAAPSSTADDTAVEAPDAEVPAPSGALSAPIEPSTDQRTTMDPALPSASDVAAVRDAAVEFVRGLTDAFGFEATVEAEVHDAEIDVRVGGEHLGVLIGPGGRTLLSIQDLARVASQRRLHDHDTRLRVDVAGYREKRRVALERFAGTVAEQVKATGVARSLDPMPSADRKVIHDALAGVDGVVSRSEGDDPDRRVVVAPA